MSSRHVLAAVLAMAGSLLPVRYAVPQDDPGGKFSLAFDGVDIHALIEAVAIRTGRTFIVDPRVKGTVDLVSSEAVDADRLYGIFLSVLEVHGFAAVDVGAITKIVPTANGVQSPVPVLGERSDVRSDAGDELVSEVIRLQGMSAPQVVEALRPLLPETALISAESTSNTVVITARAANIDRLIELIHEMDGR